MKFRQHRGGFKESMETVVEIAPTLEAICNHIAGCYVTIEVDDSNIKVEKYGTGIDHRNGWDTHIVSMIEGGGVWGFTDGPVELSDSNPNISVALEWFEKQTEDVKAKIRSEYEEYKTKTTWEEWVDDAYFLFR